MTEAAHQMTSNPLPSHGAHKPGTVGRAQGSVQVPSSTHDTGCTCHMINSTAAFCDGFDTTVCFLELPAFRVSGTAVATSMTNKITTGQTSRCDSRAARTAFVQVAILDTANRKVPTGQVGEVCIRGPNVTKGYLNRPEANKEAYAGKLWLNFPFLYVAFLLHWLPLFSISRAQKLVCVWPKGLDIEDQLPSTQALHVLFFLSRPSV
jgi:acyl-CoA synthetase (AMP-forming)/AMP-acid ligase II